MFNRYTRWIWTADLAIQGLLSVIVTFILANTGEPIPDGAAVSAVMVYLNLAFGIFAATKSWADHD